MAGKYIVYKLTDTNTDLEYVGVTTREHEEVVGIGHSYETALQADALEAHGFVRDDLFTYDNLKDAWKKEDKLAKRSPMSKPDTFNIYVGGEGELKGVGRVRCTTDRLMVHRIISGNTVNPNTDIV